MNESVKRFKGSQFSIRWNGIRKVQVMFLVTVTGILFLFVSGFNLSSGEQTKLPEGNSGIASKYPGDKNIEENPAVLFADDFEQSSAAEDLLKKWDILVHEEQLTIDKGAGCINGGNALLMTIPKRENPFSIHIAKLLTEKQDILFLRWYMKFEDGWFVPGGSVHNGGVISARYFPEGRATPGIRADGRNKFLVNCETENSVGETPGYINAYVYWPEQNDRYGDHFFPSGTVIPQSEGHSGKDIFGELFESRPDFSPQLNRWYCYEFMIKANTPGMRNGRLAMWIDGKLIADFPKMRFRDVEELKIDRFDLMFYIANNKDRSNRKWHDNVVAATSYIGPVAVPE